MSLYTVLVFLLNGMQTHHKALAQDTSQRMFFRFTKFEPKTALKA